MAGMGSQGGAAGDDPGAPNQILLNGLFQGDLTGAYDPYTADGGDAAEQRLTGPSVDHQCPVGVPPLVHQVGQVRQLQIQMHMGVDQAGQYRVASVFPPHRCL
mgnify:CR=1 FL=1